MDQSSSSAGPRVIEFAYPADTGNCCTGHVISGCQDSAAALMMVTSQASSIVIVGDENVLAIHNAYIERITGESVVPVLVVPIPAGESSKSFAMLERACRTLARENVDRACVVVGFGGGVSTDLAAMIASVWMRGVRLIQVPTSLMAMADAAIGGKFAVNIPEGRNMAGGMKYPEYVFIDRQFLRTLPSPEFVAGLVEIVKTGVVAHSGILDILAGCDDCSEVDVAIDLAVESASVKVEIVSRDPSDRGVRGLLNFGHTVGHSIESASGYGVGHGMAVASGMRIESAVSERLGFWTSAERGRLVSLLDSIGADTTPAVEFERAIAFMHRDKKNEGGQIRMALPRHRLGGPVPDDFDLASVPISLIRDCWND